jgi:hypothetical protein
MDPEIPAIDQDKRVSPHAQEVEFALILSRMINTVKEDPSQLRLAIYEFARARMTIDAEWADEAERQRLAAALETAINGVENFSIRYDGNDRLLPATSSAQIGLGGSPAEPVPSALAPIYQVKSAPNGTFVPKEVYLRPQAEPVAEMRTRALLSTRGRIWIGILLLGVAVGLVVYEQRTALLRTVANLVSPTALPVVEPVAPPPAIPAPSRQPPAAAEAKTATASSSPLPFPLPSDYGVYVVNNAALSELQLLPARVPDKRIAMSTPVNQPSRTTIADGKAKFVVFRRDLAGNAPDRIEVRVVARVVRALTFDAKGKAGYSPVQDAWNIRNISYEFRVRPIAGNPEMLLIQAENADFALPAGRYVLVLLSQGYDFTVAGKITDPSQCLERTDAANGEFYSDCLKQ